MNVLLKKTLNHFFCKDSSLGEAGRCQKHKNLHQNSFWESMGQMVKENVFPTCMKWRTASKSNNKYRNPASECAFVCGSEILVRWVQFELNRQRQQRKFSNANKPTAGT